MSIASPALSAQLSGRLVPVSFRFLLSLYAIVPLCLGLQLADTWFFGFRLRDALPSSPSHFLLFQLLFGTPHIVASNLLLVSNTDYLQAFAKKILLMSLFIIVFFGIGSLFIPYTALYILTACWTVYHVLKQQHGIAKAVCKLPAPAFYTQLWLSVSAGIFVYLGVFLKNTLTGEQADWVRQLAGVLTVALVFSTVYCQKFVPDRFGAWFLWANTLLVVCSFYVYIQQYYFMAILMPRLVHDITAYSFYITHDVNRHTRVTPPLLYRLTQFVRLPVAAVLPVLSLVLTFLLQQYGDATVNVITQTLFGTEIYKAVTLGVIGYLALMHYYTEAFVWSAGSPLRKYICFAR